MSFTCSVCGGTHAGELRDVRLALPEPIFRLDEDERESRSWVGEDAAIFRDGDRDRFFVRGLLELAVRDDEDGFRYGAWVEVGEEDYGALGELWHDPDGARAEPFRGTLANELAPYAFTEGLEVLVRLRDVRLLPLVELEDGQHELVRAQRHGISAHRAHELAASVG